MSDDEADSYLEWVRPTRRVHLALSVGMTVTGLLLLVFGGGSGSGPARPASPALARIADSTSVERQGISADSRGVQVDPMRHAPGGRGTHARRAKHDSRFPHASRTTHAVHDGSHSARIAPHDPAHVPLTPHPSDVSRPVTPAEPPAPRRESAPSPSHPAKH